jgi:hypothetical protein
MGAGAVGAADKSLFRVYIKLGAILYKEPEIFISNNSLEEVILNEFTEFTEFAWSSRQNGVLLGR